MVDNMDDGYIIVLECASVFIPIANDVFAHCDAILSSGMKYCKRFCLYGVIQYLFRII